MATKQKKVLFSLMDRAFFCGFPKQLAFYIKYVDSRKKEKSGHTIEFLPEENTVIQVKGATHQRLRLGEAVKQIELLILKIRCI